MRIAICDDVMKDRKAIAETLKAYLAARDLTAEVAEFSTAARLQEAVRYAPFDLYLLDVILSEHETGIGVARKLREDLGEVPIVFLSTSREYALDAFGVEAVSYLQKPWTQDAFFRALDRAMDALRRMNESLLIFKTSSDVVRFPASQVECVMTSQTVNYIDIVRVIGGMITIRGSVRSFAEQYGRHVKLLPAGRSLLINPLQIVSVDGTTVRFFSGRALEVPRSALPSLTSAVLSLSSPPPRG